jgi:hypothetical protein
LPHQELFEAARQQFAPLGIGPRAIKALVAGGVFSTTDLGALSESDLRNLSGIGPLTIKQLHSYLRKDDPALGDNAPLLSVKFAHQMLTEIDKWALEQKGVVSRAEAIRRLVRAGLSRTKG